MLYSSTLVKPRGRVKYRVNEKIVFTNLPHLNHPMNPPFLTRSFWRAYWKTRRRTTKFYGCAERRKRSF